MKKQHKFKLSRILNILFVILLLTAVFVSIYVSVFTLRRITDSEISREKALLENSVDLWDRTIRYDLLFLYDYMTTNENVVKINLAETETDRFYAIQQIYFDLNEYTKLHYSIEEIFFYTEADENIGFVSSHKKENDISMTIKEKALTFIDLCEADNSVGGWSIKELNGVNYLVFILQRNNNYMGCWSSVDYILQDFLYGKKDPLADHIVFITDEGGVSRTNSYLNGIQFDLNVESGQNQETGEKFLQIAQRSSLVPIYFVEHIDPGVIESAISYVRSILIILGIVLVAAVAIWWCILHYTLYRPIRTLVSHMTLLSAGDLDTRINEESRLYETSLLYDTFNTMAQEIQTLKIAVYENELQIQKSNAEHMKIVQKVNTEYMQMQIHPHFLVNGINSVSAMIDMGKYDAAKEMCAYLAEYYRYQYQQSEGLIPLQNEMRQVELYLDIQKMRHPGKLDYHIEVDDACVLVPIPPISILTFAGNSFKYGMNRETFRTDITIRVKKTSDGTHIEIRDKGPGFTDEILQHLDQWIPIVQNGRECIGIKNAMTRLKLFYNGEASFRAYNDGGAVVEIGIPDQY